jgi:uncharacterized protein
VTTPASFPAATRDAQSARFFDALRDGVLLLRRCVPHGHLSAPETVLCTECGSPSLDWVPARGTGRVVSWTATYARPDESGTARVTAVAGIVELQEGPWLRAGLLPADPALMRSGAAVILEIAETAGEPVYTFRLAGEDSPAC